MNLQVIIAKPTKDCNADCSYCSSPPDSEQQWTFDKFKEIANILFPKLSKESIWIWHGGEPMLLGTEFYKKCWEYTENLNKKYDKNLSFSMQTNLLLYNRKWKPVFRDIFKGSVSTSFDPDQKYRTLNGKTESYTRLFNKRLNEFLEDGFNPMVVSTFDEDSITYADEIYKKSLQSNNPFHIRFNYRYPAGRANGENLELISPKTYGEMLVRQYNRWIRDKPGFSITPLDQMLDITIGEGRSRCPWTRSCNGQFLGIEPNGDLYNCPDFADLGDESFKFGNIFNLTVNKDAVFEIRTKKEKFYEEIHKTTASRAHKRRMLNLPKDCYSCEHFKECQGGCMRDSVLYNRGLGGKFYYCESWKMVFKRIKESIISGEAKGIIEHLDYDYSEAVKYLKSN